MAKSRLCRLSTKKHNNIITQYRDVDATTYYYLLQLLLPLILFRALPLPPTTIVPPA